MPTLPNKQTAPSGGEPHRAREVAESFGSDAERYDRARPPYPDALVQAVIAACPGTRVLDVGCGTGIGARQFRAAGCTVLGVDPDARMADIARHSGIEVEVATLEAWDPGDRRFDMVVAGQAWHWIDPVAGAAKVAQVLRPGGRLAAFWHVFEPPPEVTDAFVTAYRREVPDSPFSRPAAERSGGAYEAILDRAADGIREAGGFGDAERWRFDWERAYTRDEWLDLLPTQGPLTRLPSEPLAKVLKEVGAAIDAMGGGFTMASTTVAVTAVRSGTV
ncbi:class I SAM-dependent methyltransferase [Streptomyces sp. NBC_01166]|uniref:class I SAM-dependent methyltransferase n=1 Tax=Streptomyces sp. NBC_01166 TaxID=2903755 RepID=UPI003867E6D5|nr:class I SAM-dependent methyltransferase [Streptomyces sp. NBC_01166]